MLGAHDEDDTLTPQVLIENLAVKATAALALRHLVARPGGDYPYGGQVADESIERLARSEYDRERVGRFDAFYLFNRASDGRFRRGVEY